MATERHEKNVPLSSEDRIRMARLYEEINGRFQEMSLIVARTLGKQPQVLKEAKLHFPTNDQPDQSLAISASGGIKANTIWIFGDGGCYQDPPGICFEC